MIKDYKKNKDYYTLKKPHEDKPVDAVIEPKK